MIKAIDTNILLDILIPNANHVASSLKCLMTAEPDDEIIISSVVFAELGSQFLSYDDLIVFLNDTGIKMDTINKKALFEASVVWKSYTSKRRNALNCSSCGNSQQIICSSCGNISISGGNSPGFPLSRE